MNTLIIIWLYDFSVIVPAHEIIFHVHVFIEHLHM